MFPCVGFMHSKVIELNEYPLTMQWNGELLKPSNHNPWPPKSWLQLIKQLTLLLLSYQQKNSNCYCLKKLVTMSVKYFFCIFLNNYVSYCNEPYKKTNRWMFTLSSNYSESFVRLPIIVKHLFVLQETLYNNKYIIIHHKQTHNLKQ